MSRGYIGSPFVFVIYSTKILRNASLELELQQAEDIALYDLQQKAHALGANAITGVTVKPEVAFCVRSLHVMVTATGTAVTVTPKP